MIDIEEYRLQEAIVINNMKSWRFREINFLPTFERFGFPDKYENLSRLRQYLNTFHERRFESYMHEDDGINVEEMEFLVCVLLRNLAFQEFAFPNKNQIIPFDTAMAALKIFLRIFAIKPDCKSILEIGPGSGFLPQFLSLKNIKLYVGIEACEVLYMLQDLQFSYLFGREFMQCLNFENNNPEIFSNNPDLNPEAYVNEYEINRKDHSYKYLHFPWWNADYFVNQNIKFDLITSNANLTEFSPYALKNYLYIINKCLKNEGIFLVCCFGGGNVSINTIFKELVKYNFALLYMQKLTVTVALFVKKGHPLFEICFQPDFTKLKNGNIEIKMPGNIQFLNNYIQNMSKGLKKKYTKKELYMIVKDKYLK